MRMVKYAVIGGLMLCGSGLAMAQEKHDEHAEHAHAAEKCPQFEAMKKLAGTWKGTGTHGEEKMDVTVTYKVTAAGSVVMETLFPGTDHEMVTMYHMEGKDLMVTHYCAMGNQPKMKLMPGNDAKVMKFDFAGGEGIDAAKDMHMHSLEMTMPDENHLKAKWTSWMEGKPAGDAKFELERQK